MADTVLTLSQLNILFQTLLISMLGLVPSGSPIPVDDPIYYAVRISWPTEGAPAWKMSDDVLCLQVTEDDDVINRQRDILFSNVGSPAVNLNQATSYTRVVKLALVFYGPNSWENAQTIRDQMFYQLNHDTLAQNNLYLIPEIISPVRFPELFQGRWWERVDMSMRFNELVIRNLTTPFITSAEVIVNEDDKGQVADVKLS